jgi:hypothetical protein
LGSFAAFAEFFAHFAVKKVLIPPQSSKNLNRKGREGREEFRKGGKGGVRPYRCRISCKEFFRSGCWN